jgi:hypothetical protein
MWCHWCVTGPAVGEVGREQMKPDFLMYVPIIKGWILCKMLNGVLNPEKSSCGWPRGLILVKNSRIKQRLVFCFSPPSRFCPSRRGIEEATSRNSVDPFSLIHF